MTTIAAGAARYISGALPWMSWNVLLALIPWALAVVMFRRGVRPGRMWWVGAGAFLLLLPNAAYVLTDVVHLPPHVRRQSSDTVVIVAVLPMFAALFTIGFLAYVDAVRRLVAWTTAAGWVRRGWLLEVAVHGVTAVGVYAGRIHRFNSWDLLLRPGEVIAATAAGFGRPMAVTGMVAVFCVLAVGQVAVTTTLRALVQQRAD